MDTHLAIVALGELSLASAGWAGFRSSKPKESRPAAAIFFETLQTCRARDIYHIASPWLWRWAI